MRIKSAYTSHQPIFAWEDDFPKAYGQTSIAFLKRCIGFEDAKNGDYLAAIGVVKKCVKETKISALLENYPNATLLPIPGRNVLPLAYAESINLPVWKNVSIQNTTPRKSLFAAQRLLHKPTFSGYICKDRNYIIVDDIVTQGGTIAAMREFVLANGGNVVAVTALAFSIGSHYIAPKKTMISRLFAKFGHAILKLELYGYVDSFGELTHSQIRYLLKFSSVRNIFNKIEHTKSLCDLDTAKLTYFPQLKKLCE